MLACARAVFAAELPRIAALAAQHPPGLAIRCIGHSLGGGVAALLACLLREGPEATAALAGARPRVSALGYGSPPVMSSELAARCSGFIHTLVNNVSAAARR
jgi:pimeloyl-ACP methyl ester carboxylesterase